MGTDCGIGSIRSKRPYKIRFQKTYCTLLLWTLTKQRGKQSTHPYAQKSCKKSISEIFPCKLKKRKNNKLIKCNFFFVFISSSSLLSARLKAFKMSLEQVPIVSKLLRASRDGNELLLKECFTEILENGISPKDLNATDKSGRVSIQQFSIPILQHFKYYNIFRFCVNICIRYLTIKIYRTNKKSIYDCRFIGNRFFYFHASTE